jgi:hypothetical protein
MLCEVLNLGATNTIDQLLVHSPGPSNPVTDRDLTRSRSPAYIVRGDFSELAGTCDDISTPGLVVVATDADLTHCCAARGPEATPRRHTHSENTASNLHTGMILAAP